MGPKQSSAPSEDLFRSRLDQLLDMNHALIKLSELIDWDRIEITLGAHFVSERGRPALPPRLVAGLLYLQHCFDCSDELVVNTWVENPYWQYFTGETYLQTKSPIDPSSLRTRFGRVHREVHRKLGELPQEQQAKAQDLLGRVQRVLTQKTKDKNKLYALHALEVECISKGMRSMPGNPWDGHTLDETVEQVSILTDRRPKTVIVDKGYTGMKIDGVEILRSGQRRVTRTMRAMIKRRSAIEPAIGHMKMDGRLGRNPLKGALGDALHAAMCGAGHNLRMLLRKLRLLCAIFGVELQAILGLISLERQPSYRCAV